MYDILNLQKNTEKKTKGEKLKEKEMKARKMKLAALGLAAAMIMGLAAPAMADELSDGFGQEDVINTESSYEGLDLGGACGNAPAAPEVNENTAPAAPANNESAQENTAETADREKEPSFEDQLKEDALSGEKEQEEEIDEELTSDEGKGDPEANDFDVDVVNKMKTMVKSLFFGVLDRAGRTDPHFFIFVGPIKNLFEMIYNPLGPQNNAPTQLDKIQEQLNAIQAQIDVMEASLKDHTSHVVELNAFGTEFNNLTTRTKAANMMIKNINGNSKFTEEQKTQKIADLYNSSYMSELMASIESVNSIFWGDTSNGLYQRSIFDAAYDRACEDVMFSQEAIEMTRPYLARQILKYLAAYATYAIILDAYDTVNGSEATLESRRDMDQHLAGVYSATPGENSIFSLYINYYNKSKYIFVDKGRAGKGIDLNPEILVKTNKLMTIEEFESKTPGYLSNMPLNEEQVKHLAEYAKEKNISLFSFLFNRMGFVPRTLSKTEIEMMHEVNRLLNMGNKDMLAYSEEMLRQEIQKTFFESNGKGGYTASGNPYVVAGRQSFDKVQEICFGYCAQPMYIRIKAIHATNGDPSLVQLKLWGNYGYDSSVLLFFQGA